MFLKAVNKFKDKSTKDPDVVLCYLMRVVRDCAVALLTPLSYIFNLAL